MGKYLWKVVAGRPRMKLRDKIMNHHVELDGKNCASFVIS
jgi:hypothetical protein